MKKFLSCIILCSMVLAACGQTPPEETTLPDETVVSTETTESEEISETVEETQEAEPEPEPDLPEINVYVVGGTTVGWVYDLGCYYASGYAPLLSQYMNEKAIIHDFALGGYTTRTYTKSDLYTSLWANIKEGDYLILAFGNGEASKVKEDHTKSGSFNSYLYQKYILPAQEAGAIPILCTPVVSANENNDYTGDSAHITAFGDFPQAIRNIGEALDIPVIDLNTITKNKFEEIGYEEAKKFHAVATGYYAEDNMTVIPDYSTLNTTQLNCNGADYVAYRLAAELANIEGIGDYVKKDTKEPNPCICAPFAGYSPEPLFEVSEKPIVYLVGDSTVERPHYGNYYYRTCGYGVQIHNYFSDDVIIKNLGLGARSSRSFLEEPRYEELKNTIKAGDILIIGFGHNDASNSSLYPDRFTEPSGDYTNPATIGYHLYEYYIKLARDAGAIPILCTPMVYLKPDDDYSGHAIHHKDAGNYHQAILDTAAALDVPVVDLTSITKEKYEELGYEEAKKFHAVPKGKYAEDGTTIVPDWDTVDQCHPNIYGSNYLAYRIASEIQSMNIPGVSEYVKENLTEPSIDDIALKNIYYIMEE
ncbi:MAG: hypothetical protein E7658_07345 [Ruminococcaceae bacterium]|nr:hypothetical protein [Oscillospiraceae bacterium]